MLSRSGHTMAPMRQMVIQQQIDLFQGRINKLQPEAREEGRLKIELGQLKSSQKEAERIEGDLINAKIPMTEEETTLGAAKTNLDNEKSQLDNETDESIKAIQKLAEEHDKLDKEKDKQSGELNTINTAAAQAALSLAASEIKLENLKDTTVQLGTAQTDSQDLLKAATSNYDDAVQAHGSQQQQLKDKVTEASTTQGLIDQQVQIASTEAEKQKDLTIQIGEIGKTKTGKTRQKRCNCSSLNPRKRPIKKITNIYNKNPASLPKKKIII